MTVLDYLLLFEILILLAAAVFWAIGEALGRGNPRDELRRLMRTFWHQVLLPRPGTAVAFLVARPEVAEEVTPINPGDATTMLKVHITGGAARNAIKGASGDEIEMQIMPSTESGEANKIVIDLLAKALGLQAYRIKLVKGHYGPRKQLQAKGIGPEQAASKLANLS